MIEDMPKSVTIIDVARKAKLSIKTVSRILNDEPHVRPQTREKVLAAARELNYRPNISARSLAGSRSYLIGLVYDNPSTAYVLAIQEGVLARCESMGFNLLIHPCDSKDKHLDQYIKNHVMQSRLDGIILFPSLSDNRTLILKLTDYGIKHTRISQLNLSASSHYVSTNEREISHELINYLISLGHTRIACIKGPDSHGGSRHRFEGYMTALEEAGISIPDSLIEQGDFTFEAGFRCATALLNRAPRPTAIFAANDYMAAGVMNRVHQENLKVPADISIAGFDDAAIARHIWPLLTTVRQPVGKLAGIAAEMLVKMIKNQPLPEDTGPLECELVIRDSTGPCAGN